MKTIDSFSGHWNALSNFHQCKVLYNGLYYNSVEAAYQAAKMDHAHSSAAKVRALLTKDTPFEAKAVGNLVPLREDWEQVKVVIMRDILRNKFAQNTNCRLLLLSTDNCNLVEGNIWHDNFWGSCKCPRCGDKGANHLGKLLMEIRSDLRELETMKEGQLK